MKRAAQAGAALLAAMLTVTLVATFAAAALWQQWRSVEVEAADRTRVQSSWILTGALDWARLILREDRNRFDHLGEPWAVPLQEARLSTFLAADAANNADTGDADQVFLSGEITDLQSRLNLGNLVRAGNLDKDWVEVARRLFEVLGLPPSQLANMAENLRFASDIAVDNRNASRAALTPQRLEQLAWLGLPPQTIAVLEPYVTLLPTTGQPGTVPTVNVNTAPAQVIYAAVPGISLADAQRLVAERERKPFQALADVKALLPEGAELAASRVYVATSFFEVRGRLRMDDVTIEERSIVQRVTLGQEVRTLQRERVAPSPPTAPATRRNP
ncbi:type II secretion system minor pseudopilin GspK [Ramlibacter pallidus]|uniref:Type II secretion system protein K n=1 Tax=Ramlibacter pallidus TaxID=2780087 RepID=A0ABR9S0Z5_9BURK|nr:type II secretion system minor pseudopilin GspK [Ramlibacter pallidus]MBE7366769.1 type II secretion system minor pseudopilin GspK [Ramlibacter pallidus]